MTRNNAAVDDRKPLAASLAADQGFVNAWIANHAHLLATAGNGANFRTLVFDHVGHECASLIGPHYSDDFALYYARAGARVVVTFPEGSAHHAVRRMRRVTEKEDCNG